MPRATSTKEPTRRALVDVVKRVLEDRLNRHRDGEQRVAGEPLVDDHAGDAHHGRTAVVALHVELELLAGLAGLVLVADPERATDIAGGHVRERRPGRDGAAGHVRELDVLRDGEIPRPAETGLRDEDVEARSHGEAPVLDLELLVAAVLVRHLV